MEKKKRGKRSAPEEPTYKARMIRARVSQEEYEEFMALAEARGMTLSELIRAGLRLLKIY